MNNIFLQQDEAEKLSSLAQNILGLTAEQEKEFFELKKKNDALVKERTAKLEEFKTKVKTLKYTIDELFTVEEIKAIAIELNIVADNASKSKTRTPRKSWRASDNNEVVLTYKSTSGRGRAFTYRKGRIFEGAQEGEITASNPVYPKSTFPKSFIEFGGSEKDLLSIATEEGKKYFATPEGKKELAEILRVIAEYKKENPEIVADLKKENPEIK